VERLLADTSGRGRARRRCRSELDRLHVRPLRIRANCPTRSASELQRKSGIALRRWWVDTLFAAQTPAEQLRERMTLFWHNHFVSSVQKVKSAKLMLDQNRLLRRHALGRFDELLHAVGKDPAMVVYLDSATSRRGSPNENFAREVMELFTLGEGNYREQDVKEAARAFTGWSIEPATGEFRWRPFIHDDGEKTVLGVRGRLDGDAVLDILLAQPQTAEHLTRKLWREFVSPTPDEREVRRIASRLRGSGYDLRLALGELLRSPAFWAAENRQALVKSPVDYVVGSFNSLAMEPPDTAALAGPPAPAGAGPVCAAECQGLARRRNLDQQQHPAGAQTDGRAPVAPGRARRPAPGIARSGMATEMRRQDEAA
jgi:uncharacterized protein (DUF1800 family)